MGLITRALSSSVALCMISCGSSPPPEPALPDALPFELARPGATEPLPSEEVSTFTRRVGQFYVSTSFFEWIMRTSHGVHASTGKPDFDLWWDGVEAVKQNGVVTFRHTPDGGGHNIYIASSRVLAAAVGGYLLTGDAAIGRIVEQYAKGVSAACRGMVFDAADPNPYLMARNFVAQNHSYEIEGGRKKAVDFTAWYSPYEEWNTHRIHYPNNPTWGDIWVTNMRSKDDVPHIYLAALWLRYAMEYGKDEPVRAAAALGIDCVRGFAKDIVDSGYLIRAKDSAGKPFVPDQDLASFVRYDEIAKNGECSAKLTSAFLGYGDSRGNDCGLNDRTDYESIAVGIHYYNYAIVRTFHLSALLAALIGKDVAAAKLLLTGLSLRLDRYLDPSSEEPGRTNRRWDSDLASYLLVAASLGLPLRQSEARLIHTEYGEAIDEMSAFPRWDLWSDSVPDGTYGGFRPPHGSGVRSDDLGFPLLYCYSPFRSRTGAVPIDCALLAERSRWGT